MSTEALIRERLAGFAAVQIEIIDDSALHAGHAGAREGGHFRLRIVAEAFRGKTTLARHREIHAALGDLMRGRIHALSIRAQTPDEV